MDKVTPKISDFIADGREDKECADLSLVKLCNGRKIKDIIGYLDGDFDCNYFHPYKLIFEDGTELYCEGEHDHPYFAKVGREKPDFPLFNDKMMRTFYAEQNGEEYDGYHDD